MEVIKNFEQNKDMNHHEMCQIRRKIGNKDHILMITRIDEKNNKSYTQTKLEAKQK